MKLVKKIKDEVKYVADAIPKIASAYSRKIIGDIPEDDVQEFRKSLCEVCPLFNGSACNRDKLVYQNGEEVDELEFKYVEKNQHLFVVFKVSGIIRAVEAGDKKYYRGCGCPQTGKAAKWKLQFDEKDLAKTDGSGPCPMGKWSIDRFEKWKQENEKK